jgi:hypothetical protein
MRIGMKKQRAKQEYLGSAFRKIIACKEVFLIK